MYQTPLVKQVIPLGLEPKTYSLEGCCSIQLSYGTRPLFCENQVLKAPSKKRTEPISGFEPETPSLRVKCSTAELNRQWTCDFDRKYRKIFSIYATFLRFFENQMRFFVTSH